LINDKYEKLLITDEERKLKNLLLKAKVEFHGNQDKIN